MATKCAASVSVLEGSYSNLYNCGMPLALCVHLEDQGLGLGSAVWTAKQTSSGFSICLFWDQSKSKVRTAKSKKAETMQRKLSNCASIPDTDHEVSQSHGMQDSVASPPISAHPMWDTSQPGSEASEDDSPLYEESEGDIHLG